MNWFRVGAAELQKQWQFVFFQDMQVRRSGRERLPAEVAPTSWSKVSKAGELQPQTANVIGFRPGEESGSRLARLRVELLVPSGTARLRIRGHVM